MAAFLTDVKSISMKIYLKKTSINNIQSFKIYNIFKKGCWKNIKFVIPDHKSILGGRILQVRGAKGKHNWFA